MGWKPRSGKASRSHLNRHNRRQSAGRSRSLTFELLEGRRVLAGLFPGVGGTGQFVQTAQFAGQLNLDDIALGDIDGDGDIDAIAEGRNNSPATLYRNNGKGSFTAAGTYQFNNSGSTSFTNYRVELGDLDGDGDLDVVGSGRFGARVWKNTGSGFTNTNQNLGQERNRTVELGDLDGDGDLDLLLGAGLFYNNGSGVFTAAVVPSFQPSSLTYAQIVDLDDDGDKDIVTGSSTQGQIWLRDGSGYVLRDTLEWSDASPREFAVGDITNDGNLDIALTTSSKPSAYWVSDGTGKFAKSAVEVDVVGAYVRLHDFDGDADLDILTSQRLLLNNGSGGFVASPDILTQTIDEMDVADLDGDGDLDVFADGASQPVAWLNSDTKVQVRVVGVPASEWVAPSDNLVYEVVVENNSNWQVSSLKVAGMLGGPAVGLTLLSVTASPGATHTLTPGAIADDLQDTLTLPGNSSVVYRLATSVLAMDHPELELGDFVTLTIDVKSNGTQTIGNASQHVAIDKRQLLLDTPTLGSRLVDSSRRLGDGPTRDVALGDLDGDGDLDAFVSPGSKNNQIWLNDGTGLFHDSEQRLSTDPHPDYGDGNRGAVALGDVDGDGDLDAVVSAGYRSRLWLNDGSGNFTVSLVRFNVTADQYEPGGSVVLLEDFDNNGTLDVALLDASRQSRMWFGAGDGTFNRYTNINLGRHASAEAADVDGDGDIDIVGDEVVLLNNGAGVFDDSGRGSFENFVQLGDLDGDGDVDFLDSNASGRTTVRLNDGTGNFSTIAGYLESGTAGLRDVQVADFDGDGDLDVFQIHRNGKDRLWLNNGLATFTDSKQSFPLSAGERGATGDLDGDGDVDLLIGNFFGANRVFVNASLPELVDLSVERTPLPLHVQEGELLTYSVTVSNPTRSDVTGVNFSEMLTKNLVDAVLVAIDTLGGAVSVAATGSFGSRLNDTLTLPAVSTVTYHFTARVAPSGTPFHSAKQTAVASSEAKLPIGWLDPQLLNNSASSSMAVDLAATGGSAAFNNVFATGSPAPLNVEGVALGDLNGDGVLDAVIAVRYGNTNFPNQQDAVWLGNGDGTFKVNAQALSQLDATVGVALADMDADGDLDAVFITAKPALRVWLNDGSGHLVDSLNIPLAGGASSLAVSDLNGDGNVDVFVAGVSRTESVWMNDGVGNLSSTGQSLSLGGMVELGDLDGDGDMDGVLGDQVIFNDGHGIFTAVRGANVAGNIELRDFDADGDLDFVVANNGGVRLWLNDGRGTFKDSGQFMAANHVRDLAAADFDGDGDIDFVAACVTAFGDRNRVFVNDGTGVFSLSTVEYGDDNTTFVVAGDLNNDGAIDFLELNSDYNESHRVWLNASLDIAVRIDEVPSSSKFRSGDTIRYLVTAENLTSTAVVDAKLLAKLTGFDQIELLSITRSPGATSSHSVGALGAVLDDTLNLPAGGSVVYEIEVRVAANAGNDVPFGLVAHLTPPEGLLDGDLSNNSATELNRLELASTGGTGLLQVSPQVFPNAESMSIAMGDLDGDGDLDAYIGVDNLSPSIVLLNNGDGTFAQGVTPPDRGYARNVLLGDLDGDGDLDAVAGHVLLNNGAGVFTRHASSLPGDNSIPFGALADVDGDGDLDLVPDWGYGSILLNDGTGRFSVGVQVGSSRAVNVAPGDIDGDGDIDLVYGYVLFVNRGDGFFERVNLDPSEDYARVALGDVDHDDDLDIVYSFSSTTWILLNDGLGRFSQSGQSLGNLAASDVSVADFNSDGHIDILLDGRELWLNDGSGVFSNSGQSLRTFETRASAVGDLDGDGDIDAFFVGGEYTSGGVPNEVWLNGSGSDFVDLSVSNSSPSSTVVQGQTTSYTLTITNNGPAPVVGAALLNRFSRNLTNVHIVSASPTGGASANFGLISANGYRLDGTLNLPVGSSFTFQFEALVAAAGTAYESADTVVWSTASITTPVGVEELTPIDNLLADSDLVRLTTTGGNATFAQLGDSFGNTRAVGDVALGDIDGDGDLDMFIGNRDRQPDTVWWNDGRGNFVDSGQRLGNDDTEGVVLVDLDGDGDLDAVANTAAWRNNGEGIFEAIPGNQSGRGTSQTVAADLNGDGSPDLITYGLVLFNDGQGKLTYTNQELPYRVTLGDVDGDGDLDLIGRDNTNELWLNDGRGQFTFARSFTADGNNYHGIPNLVDLDGDGDLDAFFSGAQRPVWINDGLGGFTRHAQSLTVSSAQQVQFADIDNDGDLDALFAVGGNVPNTIYLNDGNANFVLASATLGSSWANSLALGDLDSDGDIDAVVVNYSDQGVAIWFNLDSPRAYDLKVDSTSDRTSVAPGETVTYFVTVRNDGPRGVFGAKVSDCYSGPVASAKLVSIEASPGSSSSLNLGTLTGGFVDTVDLQVGASITYRIELTAASYLSDHGMSEAIISNGIRVSTQLGEGTDLEPANNSAVDADVRVVAAPIGTGHFTPSGHEFGVNAYAQTKVADLNGDGHLDVLILHRDTASTVWFGAHGDFVASEQVLGFGYNTGGVLGDLDNDGDLDLLLFVSSNSSHDDESVIWLNDGSGHFLPQGPMGRSFRSQLFALGDMDGDGDLDAVSTDGVWTNNGQAQFSPTAFSVPTNNSTHIDLGDIDGDGDLDAILSGGPTRVWTNNGLGQFSESVQSLETFWTNSTLGDIDDDGDLDVLVGRAVLANDGRGKFSTRQDLLAAGIASSNVIDSQLLDLDGDGDLDALIIDRAGSRAWFNDGTGRFVTNHQVLAMASVGSAAFGDLDSDGDIDFITSSETEPTRLWRHVDASEIADVSVVKTAPPDLYRGELITYRIELRNDGTGDTRATFVDHYDPLLKNLKLKAIALTGGATTGLQLGAISSLLQEVVFLPAGSSIVLEVTAETPPSLGPGMVANMKLSSGATIAPIDSLLDTNPTNQHSVALTIAQLPSVPNSGILQNTGQQHGATQVGGVELGDLDGDGDLDAFVANREGANQVLINDGRGWFTPTSQVFDEGLSSTDVALGDFDGDGDLDAFITTQQNSQRLFWNDGTGKFVDSQQSFGNSYGIEALTVDIDGDGDLDVAVNVWSGDGWRVWLNDGLGNLSTQSFTLTSSRWRGANLGELNGDGVPDAFVAWVRDDRTVYLGAEPGKALVKGSQYDEVLDNVDYSLKPIFYGDVDRDGDLDVFSVSENVNRWWINDGLANFTPGPSLVSPMGAGGAVGDIDGDGIVDALVAGRNGTSQSYLSGSPTQVLATGVVWDVALGDLDGDGDLDAVFAAELGTQVWLNSEPTDLTVETRSTPNAAVGQPSTYVVTVRNDGPSDAYQAIVTTNLPLVATDLQLLEVHSSDGAAVLKSFEGPASAYQSVVDLPAGSSLRFVFSAMPGTSDFLRGASDASLTWRSSVQPSISALDIDGSNNQDYSVQKLEPKAVVGGAQFTPSDATFYSGIGTDVKFADFDSDGRVDIILSYRFEGTKIFFQSATGAFNQRRNTNTANFDTFAIAVGNVDGDQHVESVLGNRLETTRLVQSSASGTSLIQLAYNGNTRTRDLLLADVNGDGFQDIIELNVGEPSRVLIGSGSGTLQRTSTFAFPTSLVRAGVGDFDGDGDLDLYLACGDGSSDQLWWGDGTGNFVDSGQRLGVGRSTDVAIGDIDGDGSLDAVVSSDTSPNTIFLNDGYGRLVASWQTATAGGAGAVALADFDADGDLDIVLASSGNLASRVLFNDHGSFTQYLPLNGGYQSTGVAVGDINGDGTVDIVFAGIAQSKSQLWLNQDPRGFGDYDRNGVTDAADYSIWKLQFGATGQGLSADGNGDGRVNLADFSVWRDQLGTSRTLMESLAGIDLTVAQLNVAPLVDRLVGDAEPVPTGSLPSVEIGASEKLPSSIRPSFPVTTGLATLAKSDSVIREESPIERIKVAVDLALESLDDAGYREVARKRVAESSAPKKSRDTVNSDEAFDLKLHALGQQLRRWRR
ncbi:FG-GAP-like repeat-containing protein [Aeoliella sp. SH292]|uniref:FG-GAP-like repeat-containing protein n=1 Tax=Aeoliella sp. SH292 TaxID=3454464 RepID=UPI003F98522D